MVVFRGRWSTVRKTVVGVLVDKDGKCFKVRLLVDSGATVSLMLMHSLFLTRGNWDFGTTPKMTMHGINGSSFTDLMVKATFIPGPHIPKNFKEAMGLATNFGITLDFFCQRDVRVYKDWKAELPTEIVDELVKPEYVLADPEQAASGAELLYVHGIIGEDQIDSLDETVIRRVGTSGMKVTRTKFGDLLHGKSHFIEYPFKKGKAGMREEWDCSIDNVVHQYGLEPVPLSSVMDIPSPDPINDYSLDFLKELTY
jgi:hypothetical protein